MGVLIRSKIEYVSWAVNWMSGCDVGCAYCYAAAMARRFRKQTTGTGPAAQLRVLFPSVRLSEEIARRREPVTGMILVSSSHDPAMSGPVASNLQNMVQVLVYHGLAAQTMILTKRPTLALKALMEYASTGLWFGTSLTGNDLRYEPGAESPVDRASALCQAGA